MFLCVVMSLASKVTYIVRFEARIFNPKTFTDSSC